MKLHPQRFVLPLFPRRLIALAALALCSGHALAVDPFTVRDIRVEGIQRTEAGTVFSYLPVRVGETFTDEKGAAAIKALYATGARVLRLREPDVHPLDATAHCHGAICGWTPNVFRTVEREACIQRWPPFVACSCLS